MYIISSRSVHPLKACIVTKSACLVRPLAFYQYIVFPISAIVFARTLHNSYIKKDTLRHYNRLIFYINGGQIYVNKQTTYDNL